MKQKLYILKVIRAQNQKNLSIKMYLTSAMIPLLAY